MFSCLNPQELEIVLNAMQNKKKKAGDLIIKEGDDGDNLYVVESGVLTCTKIFVRIFYIFIHSIERANRTNFLERISSRRSFWRVIPSLQCSKSSHNYS